MLRRTQAALLALAVVLAGIGVQSRLTASTIDARLADELRFRRDFGLSTDVAFVSSLIAQPNLFRPDVGVALTSDEYAEMKRRQALDHEMAALAEEIAGLPGYAGIWMDHGAGGVIVVATSGDARQLRANLELRRQAGLDIEVVGAEHDWAQLERTIDRIEADRLDLKQAGLWIRELGIDPRTNRVEVAVEELNDDHVAELMAKYGPALDVQQSHAPVFSACTDRYHCGPPWRAGIAAPTNSTIPCSLAFMVVKNGHEGWLTAGHCAKTVGVQWFHDGNSLGTIRTTCWPSCFYSDAALGGWVGSQASYHVYVSASYKIPVFARSIAYVGTGVCLSARHGTEGFFRCGLVDDIRRVDYPGGVYFKEQRYATFQGLDGDSGGAVHTSSEPYAGGSMVVAYGVQSGCEDTNGNGKCDTNDNGRSIFSPIHRVFEELGIDQLCTIGNPC